MGENARKRIHLYGRQRLASDEVHRIERPTDSLRRVAYIADRLADRRALADRYRSSV